MVSCENCRFGDEKECKTAIKAWLEREYVELFVISRKDVCLLAYVKDDYKYIARDYDGDIFLYTNKPEKCFGVWYSDGEYVSIKSFNVRFPIIKRDDSEPWLIEDLKHLPVVDNY